MKKEKIFKNEEERLKHHTRRLSIKEGIFFSIRTSFGDKFLAPFAILAGLSNFFVALTSTIWKLSPIGQIIGSRKLENNNKKKLLVQSFIIESFGWFLIFLTSLLYLLNFSKTIIAISLSMSLLLVVISSGSEYPPWFSLMGDVVDTKFRGRWWGKRATIISFTTIIFSIISAFLIQFFNSKSLKAIGFVIFFFIAFLARSFSAKIMSKFLDKNTLVDKKNSSLKKFIKEMPHTNFGKFTLYRTLFGAAMTLTSTLVPIYLLRDLKISYLSYILIILSGTIFSIITLNLWGKLADTFGNYKIITLTSLLMPLTPILYILSKNLFYLFIIPGLIGGTSWTAFVLVSKNFIYDNVKKADLGKYVSYFNLLLGLGSFFGGFIGSILISVIKTTWIKPIVFLFILGTVLRIIIAIFWIPKIHESRKKSKKPIKMNFQNTFIKELKPAMIEDLHEIRTIPKYLKEN